ncbi:hypothetical protein V6N12_007252 [Hibiscus sabdariffa]|uniref:RNase H type-1 domain-containing protein n=1 Tax=Hibiscus sabdariffa TaxID=183260 RepID=A0ABR2F179_9ROSI
MITARLVSEYPQVVSSDFQRINEDVVPRVQCATLKRRTKPTPGQVKINVDGGWSTLHRVATIGVIAGYHHGRVLDESVKMLARAHNPYTVEACAFVEGVRMAVSNGWENVIIERDAIGIVNRLNVEELNYSVAASYLIETKTVLRDHPGLEIRHVARDANR